MSPFVATPDWLFLIPSKICPHTRSLSLSFSTPKRLTYTYIYKQTNNCPAKIIPNQDLLGEWFTADFLFSCMETWDLSLGWPGNSHTSYQRSTWPPSTALCWYSKEILTDMDIFQLLCPREAEDQPPYLQPCLLTPSIHRQAAGLCLRTNPGTWLSDICKHAFLTTLISVLFLIQLTGTFCLCSSSFTLFSFYHSPRIFRYHLNHQWSDIIHLLRMAQLAIWRTFTYIILFNPQNCPVR